MGAGIKMVANNKKAYHDYFIDDKFEAGIELFGTEVKSIAWVNAASRKHLSRSRATVRCMYSACISAHMRRETF